MPALKSARKQSIICFVPGNFVFLGGDFDRAHIKGLVLCSHSQKWFSISCYQLLLRYLNLIYGPYPAFSLSKDFSIIPRSKLIFAYLCWQGRTYQIDPLKNAYFDCLLTIYSHSSHEAQNEANRIQQKSINGQYNWRKQHGTWMNRTLKSWYWVYFTGLCIFFIFYNYVVFRK